MLDLLFRNSTSKKAYSRAFFEAVLTRAVKVAKLQGTVAVSVSLVGPVKMRSLNKKYRHVDKPTDVLSFPLYEKLPKRYTTIDLGDIFICQAVVIQKAKEEGMPEREYLAWAAVHGFLHLTGYDHERSAKEEKKMSALERKILTK